MKINNKEMSDKPDTRETLNDWQRKDTGKKAAEAKHREAEAKEVQKKIES